MARKPSKNQLRKGALQVLGVKSDDQVLVERYDDETQTFTFVIDYGIGGGKKFHMSPDDIIAGLNDLEEDEPEDEVVDEPDPVDVPPEEPVEVPPED